MLGEISYLCLTKESNESREHLHCIWHSILVMIAKFQ